MPTIPQSHRDLLGSDVAVLATIGPDGYPQVTATWFLFDDDGTIKLSLNISRQKVKNLREHLRAVPRSSRMSTMPQKSGVTPERRRIDPTLAGIVVGAVILILAGLIAIPLAARRSPELAPETTPAGVVQRFYQAAYAGDYSAAYGYLAAETRAQLSALELQQQLAPQLQQSQMRVISTMAHDDSATVRVALTHFQPDGLFGSNEWTEERDVVLKREGQAWKIVGGPFYLPPKP